MTKGDNVLIAFPFTDLSGSKNRPALVLAQTDVDVTVSFITTQIKWQENSDITLQPTTENGLKKTSLIRLSKLTIIDKDLVIGRIGNISSHDIAKVNKNLIIVFDLK